jgi:hypothetical protein
MFVSDLLETEDSGGCNSFKASEQLVGQTDFCLCGVSRLWMKNSSLGDFICGTSQETMRKEEPSGLFTSLRNTGEVAVFFWLHF